MKAVLILLSFLSLNVFGQKPGEAYPNKEKADNIVVYFLGQHFFQNYVKLDTKKSQQRSGDSSYFHYNFKHPKFSGETFVIAFTLDSAGQFVPGKETRGPINVASISDSAWVTAKQALKICCGDALRIKKKSLRLAWDPVDVSYDAFQKSRDFRDIAPGDIVWQIDGQILFRGDVYSWKFQVNVVTGTVARLFAVPWD